jgi:hypothetical protein
VLWYNINGDMLFDVAIPLSGSVTETYAEEVSRYWKQMYKKLHDAWRMRQLIIKPQTFAQHLLKSELENILLQ